MMDAGAIGRASVMLGGGRQKTDDVVDFGVGFSGVKKVGEHVSEGEPLMFIHARTEASRDSVLPLLQNGVDVQ